MDDAFSVQAISRTTRLEDETGPRQPGRIPGTQRSPDGHCEFAIVLPELWNQPIRIGASHPVQDVGFFVVRVMSSANVSV
jgi:hypothetical protein